MNQSLPYLETEVYFLCTRVQCPTEENRGKHRIVLNYLKATKDDWRIMVSDNLLKLETWTDGSQTVNEDISFGFGIIHGNSSKQKLNIKSTT